MTDLDRTFTRLYDHLVAWCRLYVHPSDLEPDDLVHLAYLRCLRRWNAARASRDDGASYLRQAIRWAAADASRHRTLRARKLAELRPRWYCAIHADTSTRLELAEAIARLPWRQREICQQLISGATSAAIRKQLGLSRGAFAVSLCRAHANLRMELGLSRPSAARVRSPQKHRVRVEPTR
jgi:hypothetical protein